MRTATAVRTGVLGFLCALLTVTAHTSAGGQVPGPLALIGIVAACTDWVSWCRGDGGQSAPWWSCSEVASFRLTSPWKRCTPIAPPSHGTT